jgi:site-specific DNA-methyltransferase (adenine-specific)
VETTFRAPWDGNLVAFRNSDTDQLLTPNHRVYWQRNAHRSTNKVERREWVTECSQAADVPRRSQIRLPLAGHHDGPGIGGVDYAALLGWVWTEGHFDATGTGVRIYQSSVNQSACDTIAALMDRMGRHKRYDRERTYKGRTYTESTWFFTGDLANRVRTDLPSKHPTYELLWRMSAAEVEAFYEAAVAGDGHVKANGSVTFEQKDPVDREWFVTLLALSNRRGHDYARPRGGGSVSVTRSPWTNLSPKRMAETEQVFYTGDVWCVKVPSGAFVARRNGRVFITGNSGFPKSLDVSKAIDKAAGAEREVLREGNSDGSVRRARAMAPGGGERQATGSTTAPATDAARQWDGWGTALKPAHEPIVVARKPLAGTVAANVLEHGTGALNIDGCRVAGDNPSIARRQGATNHLDGGSGKAAEHAASGRMVSRSSAEAYSSARPGEQLGRWPANFVLTHAADCGDDCAPGCPVAALDEQSGDMSGAGSRTHRVDRSPFASGEGDLIADRVYGDSGGASRFFTVTEWDAVADAVPFRYQAKASKKERNAGLDDIEGKQIGAKGNGLARTCDTCGASVIDGCDCPDRTFSNPVRKNHHPTVKPVALMRWLVRLVTPPGGTVLDPFAGSGTTMVAAITEGFHPVGIEMTDDYLPIIEGRCQWAVEHSSLDYATPLGAATPNTGADTQPDNPTTEPTLFD